MKLTKKYKQRIKKKLLVTFRTFLCIMLVAIATFYMYKNGNMLFSRITGVDSISNYEAGRNQLTVSNSGDGIKLDVEAFDTSGVDKIEIYQGDSLVKTFTYIDGETAKNETIYLQIPFWSTATITEKVNGVTVSSVSNTNGRYIYTLADLETFRRLVNAGNTFAGKYVELMNDINANNTQVNSIAGLVNNTTLKFSGTFNGNHHTISNLNITSGRLMTTDNYNGLFGRVDGVIANLNLLNVTSGSTVTKSNANSTLCTYYVGGIAGYVFDKGKILNCSVTSNNKIYATANANASNTSPLVRIIAGGIVGGMADSAEINSCYSRAGAQISLASNVSNAYLSMAGGIVRIATR